MRLSRKGWNNVLIFAVFTIIFIFNFGHKLTANKKPVALSIIDKNLTLVEIKTPDFRVTRVGRSWQSQPNLGLSAKQLATLVNNWQQLTLNPHEPIPLGSHPYTILIYSADREEPITVNLIQQGDDYVLQTESNHALFLNAQQLPLLLGR
ncbi:hypothetical protein [Psychromonas sp. MME2]|uniref:hypothetical protein n=1 Tax=unclassified Psychromonas TaxID=2614957 RepID=UPI00339C29B7